MHHGSNSFFQQATVVATSDSGAVLCQRQLALTLYPAVTSPRQAFLEMGYNYPWLLGSFLIVTGVNSTGCKYGYSMSCGLARGYRPLYRFQEPLLVRYHLKLGSPTTVSDVALDDS